MAMFTVQFDTDNDAFRGNRTNEIARILVRVAQRVRDGETGGKCIDANGNSVGKFIYSPKG